jgi:uncharacterized protein (TIGR03118 family)
MRSLHRHAVAASIAIVLAWPAAAQQFNVLPLVTDDSSVHPAQITDPGLLNGWGISFSPTSPFWVSSNGAGTAVLYRVDPNTQATSKVNLTVGIPGAGNPTGQVFNSAAGSGAFNGNVFLFVSEDGTLSGWRGALGTTAEPLVAASAIYKGSAFGTMAGSSYLYAANFDRGSIDVYKGTAATPNLTGSFTDAALPTGYVPFNVQNLGGSLYVTYAKKEPGETDETAGLGLGIVDRFDLNGTFLGRVATGGTLNAPWGLAIAPTSFGAWAGQLLVGNFGDGHINVYDRTTFAFLGQLTDGAGRPLAIDGLWAITPGNDGGAGSSRLLYFSAGPDEEAHGLFGVLVAVPEPTTWSLLLAGMLAIGVIARRHRRAD